MTQLEYFRLFAAEFSTIPDETVGVWLTIAGNTVYVGYLDEERANMALALYAAHLMWLSLVKSSNGGQGTGSITMEKEGDLQRQYSTPKFNDSWIGQSVYGQQYIAIASPGAGSGIMTRVPSYVGQGH